jgi:hypothetical protein
MKNKGSSINEGNEKKKLARRSNVVSEPKPSTIFPMSKNALNPLLEMHSSPL